jgi:hypothetical protein
VIGNKDFTLLKFRSATIKEFVSQGCTVFALVPEISDDSRLQIERLGAIPITYGLSRTGMNLKASPT